MSLFISDAIAAANTVASQQNPWGSVLMLGGFVLIFYFLLWRPQSQRAKEHRNLIGGLQKGDEVIISGGLMGSIIAVGESFITLRIAEGVEVKCQKSAVANALPKGSIESTS